MEEDEYMKLIEQLKKFIGDRPFWELEKYWTLNDNGDDSAANN
jgi:hypothetical protein